MAINLGAGSELAGHRIESVIGRGGMGVVYLAQHLRLGRKVALKVLVPDLSGDELFRERFVRESQLAAALEHPNIIPIYDAGEAQEHLYISMRYVQGSDLAVRLHRDRTLSLEDTVSILGRVGSALDAAHAEGLVHRDVKPANILIEDRPDDERRIFLTDFGVTKSLRREGDSLTRAGQLIGTIDYMAPEQITGQAVDGRTDVYSLGCIAFRCLTGKVPYPRDNEVAVMYAHLQDTPPSITASRPELPSGLDRVIRRAMAKSKEARFTTCSELIQAMQTPQTRLGSVGAGRRTLRSPSRSASPPVAARRRARRLWRVGAAALVAAVAITVGVLLAGHSGAPTTNHSHNQLSVGSGAPVAPSTSTGTTGGPPVPIRLRWKPASASSEVFGGTGDGDQVMNRAIEASGGIVVVGYDESTRHMEPAVWSAKREGTWSWTKLDAPYGKGDLGMASVAALTADEVVAVGSTFIDGQYDAAAWARVGEGNWTPLRRPAQVFDAEGDQQMRRVVNAGPGLVAVGYTTSLAGDLDAAAWVYDAGTKTWAARGSDQFGGAGDQELWSVAPFANLVVAVGSDSAQGDPDAAAWWSDDGGTIWARATVEPTRLAGEDVMKTVVAGQDGLVAVGYRTTAFGDLDAAVWTSTDGKRWSLVADSPVLGGAGDQQMFGAATFDRYYVAVGSDNSGDRTVGVVWTSADGVSWHRQEPPAMAEATVQQIKSVTRVGDQLVAVGFEWNTTDKDAAAWVANVVQG